MSDPLTTITLHVQYCRNGVTVGAIDDPTEVRLHTEDGEFIAVWERTDGLVSYEWNVTTSDHSDVVTGPDGYLSGYTTAAAAVDAGVEWFRANCGVRSDVAIELA